VLLFSIAISCLHLCLSNHGLNFTKQLASGLINKNVDYISFILWITG
jgi:hypothetical protein